MQWQSPTRWRPSSGLRKHLEEDGSGLWRKMIREFAEQLITAEAQGVCNAGYGEQWQTTLRPSGLHWKTPERPPPQSHTCPTGKPLSMLPSQSSSLPLQVSGRGL